MSRRSSSPALGILIGLAIGAVAVAVYRRRASLQALSSSPSGAALPPSSRLPALSGGSAVQNVSAAAVATMRTVSMALQAGPGGLVEQARRYVDSARAQLDVAIAEGQAAAAQTRQELEARFTAAKENPESARSAFM